ncbi:MAG: NAD+ synthase, partial [Actinomycetales bacterium]
MAHLRLSLAQGNPVVGDLAANAATILRLAAQAAAVDAQVVVFGEMFLTGYPVEDLALRASFQRASVAALDDLAVTLADAGLGDLVCVVGYLLPGADNEHPRNAAAVLVNGQVLAHYAKHHLPNYGVFDEARYFTAGNTPVMLHTGEVRIALAICEDLWQDGGPVTWAAQHEAALLVVLNASPYERNKDDVRLALAQRRSREAGCSLAYVNIIGGQDELVFDGDSLIVDAEGNLLARAPQFQEVLLTVDLELPNPAPTTNDVVVTVREPSTTAPQSNPAPGLPAAERLDDSAEVYQALTLGLADYVHKNGFSSVLLGLSGGIDSALVAALACDAIGADRVFGVAMPSRYSSAHSLADAEDLAQRTGLNLRTVPIDPMVRAYEGAVTLTGLAAENLQARVRGTLLMAISNQEGHLVLTTGNKSELAVGYSTLYGDSAGGFAPIKDVPKTLVWELATWRNARSSDDQEPIPPNSITKPPSAELRPGQLDTDSLPDYHELDRILQAYVGLDRSADELIAAGFDPDLVTRVLRLTD